MEKLADNFSMPLTIVNAHIPYIERECILVRTHNWLKDNRVKKIKRVNRNFKKIKSIKRLLNFYYAVYNLIPWMIRATPIRIAAKSGLLSDNPPRMNDIIPKSIINTEAILDTFSPENMPTIPIRISKIPII